MVRGIVRRGVEDHGYPQAMVMTSHVWESIGRELRGEKGYGFATMSERVQLNLTFDTSAPRAARVALAQWDVSPETHLVVSELVTNAVLHGEPPVRLVALRIPDAVHVEVSDARPDVGPPTPNSAGLRIVEALTLDWGVALHQNDGKTIWAELDL